MSVHEEMVDFKTKLHSLNELKHYNKLNKEQIMIK